MSDDTALGELIASLNFHYTVDFVPRSKVDPARLKEFEGPNNHLSLNWQVTIGTLSRIDGQLSRHAIKSEYTQGIGHLPGYRHDDPYNKSVDGYAALTQACETGRYPLGGRMIPVRAIPAPALRDVLHHFVMDAEVLDYSSFEAYADSLGINVDSRTEEAAYRVQLSRALALRNMIGEKGLARLREAFTDY